MFFYKKRKQDIQVKHFSSDLILTRQGLRKKNYKKIETELGLKFEVCLTFTMLSVQ